MLIEINIKEKRAQALGSPVIVCGNTDNEIEFTFDDEWAASHGKTARFVYIQQGEVKHTDVMFNGNKCGVPLLSNTREVSVGVFSGALKTTTPARIPCERSILCGTSTPEAPTPSQYDQIVALLNEQAQALQDSIALAQQNSLLLVQDLQQQCQTADQNLQNQQDTDRQSTLLLAQDLQQQFQAADQALRKLIEEGQTGSHNHDDRYNTKEEITSMVLETVAGLMEAINSKSDTDHNHDDRYYTEEEALALVQISGGGKVYNFTWSPEQNNSLECDEPISMGTIGQYVAAGDEVKIRIKKAGTTAHYNADIIPIADNKFYIQLLVGADGVGLEAHSWRVDGTGELSYSSFSLEGAMSALGEYVAGLEARIAALEG